jgi:hypothetical protein
LLHLDDLYGALVDPVRVDPVETSMPQSLAILDDESAARLRALMLSARGEPPAMLCSEVPMLWVVDIAGNLRIAVEEVVDAASGELLHPKPARCPLHPGTAKRGHPSLVSGGRARIGGEMLLDPKYGWVITNRSGRFGAAALGRSKAQLEKVSDLLAQRGIEVQAFFYAPRA